jgi:hypothetical protein
MCTRMRNVNEYVPGLLPGFPLKYPLNIRRNQAFPGFFYPGKRVFPLLYGTALLFYVN